MQGVVLQSCTQMTSTFVEAPLVDGRDRLAVIGFGTVSRRGLSHVARNRSLGGNGRGHRSMPELFTVHLGRRARGGGARGRGGFRVFLAFTTHWRTTSGGGLTRPRGSDLGRCLNRLRRGRELQLFREAQGLARRLRHRRLDGSRRRWNGNRGRGRDRGRADRHRRLSMWRRWVGGGHRRRRIRRPQAGQYRTNVRPCRHQRPDRSSQRHQHRTAPNEPARPTRGMRRRQGPHRTGQDTGDLGGSPGLKVLQHLIDQAHRFTTIATSATAAHLRYRAAPRARAASARSAAPRRKPRAATYGPGC